MENLSEMFQELVRDGGERVDIHTQVCVLWKAEHKNCKGCSSELGCAKAVSMFGITTFSASYSPKDYADYERMQQSIQDKLEKVLKARSVAEVQAIRW